MKQNDSTSPNAILMALLGGATLGGFAVALAATKTGKQWLGSLKALASRSNPEPDAPESASDADVQAAFI